jgi:hypothetical protein
LGHKKQKDNYSAPKGKKSDLTVFRMQALTWVSDNTKDAAWGDRLAKLVDYPQNPQA